MEKFETTSGEEGQIITGELATLLRLLSKPDALKILYRAETGIENSTYAMEELGITQKKYYSRLRELVDAGLIMKRDGVYRQTALGGMVYDRFLPALGKASDAREEMELIVYLEGTDLENGVKKRILENLEIPSFVEPTKIKLLGDYEALAIEAIDLYDSAEESVLLATNYFDVRVIEATLRAVDRGVTNRAIMGKNNTTSKIQKLKELLSITFTKALINFASNIVELKDVIRFANVPYTFCVVDGCHSIIEFTNPLNDSFIIALSIDDRDVAEKLTKLYEMLWDTGEVHSTIKVLDALKSS